MTNQRKALLLIEDRTSSFIVDRSALGSNVTDVDDDRLVLTLHYSGMISECNKAGGKLLGCRPSELIWQHISKLLPQLKNIALLQDQDLNPYLRFLSRVGYKFEVIDFKGAHLICKVFFCEIGSMGNRLLRVIICPEAPGKLVY